MHPEPSTYFFKLAFLASQSSLAHDQAPTNWLRQALLQRGSSFPAEHVARQAFEIKNKDERSVYVQSAIRDLWASRNSSDAELSWKLHGSSALLLFLSDQDEPKNVSRQFREAARKLPPSGQVPLLVMVQSMGLVKPVQKWLTEELAALTDQRIGASNVIALIQEDRDPSQVLQGALQWLVSHCQPQPQFKETSLNALLLEDLATVTKAMENFPGMGPKHLVSMFNACLERVQGEVQYASNIAVQNGGWPPKDCLLGTSFPASLADWWEKTNLGRMFRALHGLRISADNIAPSGDAVWQYMQIHMKTETQYIASTSSLSWKQLLLLGFHYRLMSCQAACMVLKQERSTDDARVLAEVVRLSPIGKRLAANDVQKRKWTEDPGSDSEQSSDTSAQGLEASSKVQKVEFTAKAHEAPSSYNAREEPADLSFGKQIRMGSQKLSRSRKGEEEPEHRKSKGLSLRSPTLCPQVYQQDNASDVFASLTLQPEKGFDASREQRQAASDHTEMMQRVLAEGDPTKSPIQRVPDPVVQQNAEGLQGEIRENTRFLALLAELKGGF